jgi:hypothetical protein
VWKKQAPAIERALLHCAGSSSADLRRQRKELTSQMRELEYGIRQYVLYRGRSVGLSADRCQIRSRIARVVLPQSPSFCE